MSRYGRLLECILRGTSDANIPFAQMNLQSRGAKAKPYQVKQVRNVVLKYKLGGQNVSL